MEIQYGILQNDRVLYFENVSDLRTLGLVILKRTIKSEGYKYNDKGRVEYLESCIEDLDDELIDSLETASDWLANHLVYSMNMFVSKMKHQKTWSSLTNKENSAICSAIFDKLSDSIKNQTKENISLTKSN